MLPMIYDKTLFKVHLNSNIYYYGINDSTREVNKNDLMYIEKISSGKPYGLTHIKFGEEVIHEYYNLASQKYSVYFKDGNTKYSHFENGDVQYIDITDQNKRYLTCFNIKTGFIDSESFFVGSNKWIINRYTNGLIRSIEIAINYDSNADYENTWFFKFKDNNLESYERENEGSDYSLTWNVTSDITEFSYIDENDKSITHEFDGLLYDRNVVEMYMFGAGLSSEFNADDLLIDENYLVYFGDLIK